MENLKERVEKLVEFLNEGVHEREETIAVSLLGALSRQNIFLFGPPGTAKSLLARRLAQAFETRGYFEYLMHRFSTPEEVFGPVSITELKKDNFHRKTEGFLPKSDFAFLDEIWKSSPSILNTLLTIINEKLFRNGTQIESVPLKALISASNETPPPGQGLEALYDRFLVRLNVSPMEGKTNFEILLQSKPTLPEFSLPVGEAISNNEWEKWREKINEVRISKETLNVIHDIRLSFQKKGEDLDIYVSDRRWQQSAIFLKAAAFFCGRQDTNLVDALLLRHCLWTTRENHAEVVSIVENAVRNCGFETGIGIAGVDREKEELEKEIRKELYHSEDIYETVEFRGNKYFRFGTAYTEGYERVEEIAILIPFKKVKTKDEFNPVDTEGKKLDWIRCRFDGQGSCEIRTHKYRANASSYHQGDQYWKDPTSFTPKVLLRKGDRKEDVNPRLVQSLLEAVGGLRNIFESAINGVESKLNQFRKELENPFVPAHTRNIALESVEQQSLDMKLRLKDCDRLENLIAGNSSSPAISPKAVPTRKNPKKESKIRLTMSIFCIDESLP